MCGIVGMVAKEAAGFYYNHAELFKQMLLCDSVRGEDSTGVFGVLRNKQVRLAKQAAAPQIFYETKAWDKFITMMTKEMQIVVGHNRSATKGLINNENAHPFLKDNIVLVHNGTLSNHRGLYNTEVDSDAICHGFAEKGVEETLNFIQGAWALVWYDMTTKKLYLARNEDRPLTIAHTEQNLLFASEGIMLQWLAKRNNMEIKDIFHLDPHVLYEVGVGPFELKKTPIKIKKNEVVVYPTYESFPHRTHGNTMPTRDQMSSVVARIGTGTPRTVNSDVEQLNSYKNGERVIFLPDREPHDDKSAGYVRFRLSGVAYLPGKPIAKAKAWCELGMEYDDAISLAQEPKLTGIVQNFYMAENGLFLNLRMLNPEVWDKTWNDVEIPIWEFKYICDHFACKKCKQAIAPYQLQFSTVRFKDLSSCSVVCPDCIAKGINRSQKVPAIIKEKWNALVPVGHTPIQAG